MSSLHKMSIIDHLHEFDIPDYEETIRSQSDNDDFSDSLSQNSTLVSSFRSQSSQIVSGKDIDQQVDILPSFHMHQSVINRSAFIESDSSNRPELPHYSVSDVSLSTSHTSSSANSGVSGALTSNTISSTDDHLSEDSILENLSVLKHHPSPLQLEIHITKKPCHVNQLDNSPETPLKEYTSGDYVYGYFTVKNTSDKGIKFEQIVVSLEGVVTICDPKTGSISRKNFLRMYDLGGSFTVSDTNLRYCKRGCILDHDGTILCIPNDQILDPGVTVKKFFEFKFPVQLLDQTCESGQLSHLILPPTFGVDCGERRNLVYNNILGYGRSNRRGTPFKLNDYCPENVSVNYSLNVRIIGENPNKEDVIKFSIFKESDFHIRFIPFGFCIPFEYELSTTKQVNSLYETMERELEELKQRSDPDNCSSSASASSALSQEQLLNRKREQLPNPESVIPVFPLPNSVKESIVQKSSLLLQPTLKQRLLGGVGVGKDHPLGTVDLQSNRPNEGIPYIISKVVQDFNKQSSRSDMGNNNINLMRSALTSSEKKNLQEIEFDLVFRPHSNSVKPPQIKGVTIALEINTIHSKKAIPFTFNQDVLTDMQNIVNIKEKFAGLVSEFKNLPKGTKIPRWVSDDLNAISGLKVKQDLAHIYQMMKMDATEWKLEQEITDDKVSKLKWTKKVKIQLRLQKLEKLTVVPTFQSCYMSRFYNVLVNVNFQSAGLASLKIPVRVRKFDF